jgi:hypothetical protein
LPLAKAKCLLAASDLRGISLRLALSSVRSGKKISADHLQTVSSGLIASQHKGGRLEGFLNDGQLTLVELEIDNLPGLRVLTIAASSISVLVYYLILTVLPDS